MAEELGPPCPRPRLTYEQAIGRALTQLSRFPQFEAHAFEVRDDHPAPAAAVSAACVVLGLTPGGIQLPPSGHGFHFDSRQHPDVVAIFRGHDRGFSVSLRTKDLVA